MLSRLLTISTLIGLALSAVGDEYHQACRAVEAAMSNASDVYYPGEYDHEQIFGSKAKAHGSTGNPLYTKGEYHYFASSQESPACVVEPGTPEDVGKIVRLIHSASSGILHRPR